MAFLFPGRNPEHHYTTRQMASWFSEILRLADIEQQEKGPHERDACLHCFRHLVVLKSMQQLEAAGRPVDVNNLFLPTYLGHDRLIDTNQYMRFPGPQVPEAMDAFETFTAGLIPHVEVPYKEEYCCPCYQASGCTSSTTAPWTMVWSWSPTPVSA